MDSSSTTPGLFRRAAGDGRNYIGPTHAAGTRLAQTDAMAIQRSSLSRTDLTEVLDRVLDKGIVIDACVRISIAGIELVGIDARVTVASIATYLRLSETAATTASVVTRKPLASPKRSVLSRGLTEPRRGSAPGRQPVRQPAIVTQYCSEGCSFKRAVRHAARTVRCPYEAGRVCALRTA